MALPAVIKCAASEIALPEDVLDSYCFTYLMGDAYAKKNPESVRLTLELDVTELLSSDADGATLADNLKVQWPIWIPMDM